MRSNVTAVLNTNKDYWIFLRENAIWHRTLSRYPSMINKFLDEYKVKRRKRLIDKVEDVSSLLDLVNKMME